MNKLDKVRVSGCEPLLNKEHLLTVIKLAMEAGYKYVLDTNALLIDEAFLDELEPFKDRMYMYVGLKGSTPELFEQITKADKRFWYQQLEGLRLIVKRNFRLGINLMANLTPTDSLIPLFETLYKICPVLPMTVDMKHCTYFVHNARRIKQYGLKTHSGSATSMFWNRVLDVNYGDATDLVSIFQTRETEKAFDRQEMEVLHDHIEYDNGLKFVRSLPFSVPVLQTPVSEKPIA